ncbi:hypothetical protein Y032_0205g1933 [Ancylostoma ceylanicum]|uniref:Uncharacterized protein n=1 Tax=Ancylostoma ceylanicum TaxID=53326 RepID=A0A016SMG7_9BILA|nr:hypothetical protein Y032_0205g1933 [Ancylostoma ceylanicum]
MSTASLGLTGPCRRRVSFIPEDGAHRVSITVIGNCRLPIEIQVSVLEDPSGRGIFTMGSSTQRAWRWANISGSSLEADFSVLL